jgi:hypothetical protein
MNIKEMYSLAERLLSEGVDPNTPVAFVKYSNEHGIPGYDFVETSEVKLVRAVYDTPDGKCVEGPVVVVNDAAIDTVVGYRHTLDIPKFPDFKEILTRQEPIVAPTEFVLTTPVFDGPQKPYRPVTYAGLLELINRRFFHSRRLDEFSPRKVSGVLNTGSWVTAEFEGTSDTNNFDDVGRGFFIQEGTDLDDVTAPIYLHFSGHSHGYIVNLRTSEVKVRLYGTGKWETWDDHDKKVSDSRSAVAVDVNLVN